MLKNGELLLEIEDRDCYFWGQDDQDSSHAPDRGRVHLSRLGLYL